MGAPHVYTILAFVGVYALAAFADRFPPAGDTDPLAAYGVVLAALPPLVAALGLLAALAASISTATTAHIGATSTAVRDLYQKFVRPEASGRDLVVPSRIILLALGVMTWLLAFYPGGPLYLFAFAAAWLGPPSVLLMLGAWWRRTSTPAAVSAVVGGMTVMAVLTALDLTGVWSISQYTTVGVVGFTVTLFLAVLVSLVTKPKYYGDRNWSGTVARGEVTSMDDDEQQLVELVRCGYHTMAEVTDLCGWDSRKTNAVVERLDKKGVITRQRLAGRGFYVFDLGPNADQILTPYEGRMAELAADDLMEADVELLEAIGGGELAIQGFTEDQDYSNLQTSSMISKLVRLGYVHEGGLFRRVVQLSSPGEEILAKYDSPVAGDTMRG